MSFIGIICDKKSESYLENKLTKKLINKTIIIFNEENIENFKNIKFETVAILKNNVKVIEKTDILKNIISKVDYLIVNADEEINLNVLEKMDLNIITFGFNSKSTITASSVKDEDILLCLQRTILDVNLKQIEPQEISIKKDNLKTSTDIIMGIATILLLYGIEEMYW